MEIRKIPISDINPASYNPRVDLQPGDPEYERLRTSIKKFDLVEPLIWNKQTGNLVGGHQRLKILKEEGRTEVDVSVVDLSEKKEKALNLVLNKVTGRWEALKLRQLLQEIGNEEFTGFSEPEIDDLIEKYKIQSIDDLLAELDLSVSVGSPIWVVIRTGRENQKFLEEVLKKLNEKEIRAERSYEIQMD